MRRPSGDHDACPTAPRTISRAPIFPVVLMTSSSPPPPSESPQSSTTANWPPTFDHANVRAVHRVRSDASEKSRRLNTITPLSDRGVTSSARIPLGERASSVAIQSCSHTDDPVRSGRILPLSSRANTPVLSNDTRAAPGEPNKSTRKNCNCSGFVRQARGIRPDVLRSPDLSAPEVSPCTRPPPPSRQPDNSADRTTSRAPKSVRSVHSCGKRLTASSERLRFLSRSSL
jgi:hypothetical protein